MEGYPCGTKQWAGRCNIEFKSEEITLFEGLVTMFPDGTVVLMGGATGSPARICHRDYIKKINLLGLGADDDDDVFWLHPDFREKGVVDEDEDD